MIGAMFYGLTGLRNHQTRIDVIGNNVANINTAGFKKSRVNFKESFNRLISSGIGSTADRGSINPKQIGYGSQLGSIDVIHTEGNIQLTGNPTDLAIKGDGFFILRASEAVADLTAGDYVYTRAGNFDIDANGNLIYKPNGLKVQGWRVNSEGEINTAAGELMDISIKFDRDGNQIFSTPRETSEIDFGGNLNSQAGIVKLINDGGTGITEDIDLAVDSPLQSVGLHRVEIKTDEEGNQVANLSKKDGTVISSGEITGNQIIFPQGLKVSFRDRLTNGTAEIDITPRKRSTSIGIYDSKGAKHTLEISFARESPENVWAYKISPRTVGDRIAKGKKTEADFQGQDVVSGLVKFKPTGILQSGDKFKYITIKPAGGADLINIEIDLTEVTQFADNSDVSAINQNGIGPGQLESFQISSTGDIIGIYSNGVSQNIGKIALADVPNPEGLSRFQDTIFLESASSGTVLPKQSGTFGLGSLSSGALELSNVNLTDEFTDLIVSERGFQANSRVITTSDEILVEALNLKR